MKLPILLTLWFVLVPGAYAPRSNASRGDADSKGKPKVASPIWLVSVRRGRAVAGYYQETGIRGMEKENMCTRLSGRARPIPDSVVNCPESIKVAS